MGRTAVFVNLNDAREDYLFIKRLGMEEGYKVVIIRVEITKDLMSGVYTDSQVVAGRYIRFIKEVR